LARWLNTSGGPKQVRAARFFLIASLFAAAAPAVPLRVLTWNVRGLPFTAISKRIPRIAAVVAERRPDFVAFEEVWTAGQVSAFRRALEPIGYASGSYTRSPIRPGGLLLLWDTRKGWRVDDLAFIRYQRSSSWWRLDEGDALARNGFLIGNARNADGRAFRIAVTHLQAQYREHGRTYDDVRLAQVQQLAAAAGEPAVIMGDFNTLPADSAYRWLVEGGWRDATAELRQQCQAAATLPCGTNFDDGKLTSEWIDYVFLRGGTFGALAAELIRNVHPNDYSDHEGVVCTIAL
jgi:endonuclease/exonuclease/phosphatase family metal-dependent hydrolase